MKEDQVPQDSGSLSTKNMQELCYAVDDDGKFVTVPSSGWEVKTVVLQESLKIIDERVQEAKNLFLEGKASPIHYFMELNRMDVPVLSSYVGIHRFFVKRHLKPKSFKNLSAKTLAKYAEVFQISLSQLQHPFE